MNHSKIRFFLFGCLFVGLATLSGCAALAESGLVENDTVKEADEVMVKKCQFLGTFSDTTHDPNYARNTVLHQAAKKGATHYVLMDTSKKINENNQLMSRYDIRIRAYKCGGNKSTSSKKASKKK